MGWGERERDQRGGINTQRSRDRVADMRCEKKNKRERRKKDKYTRRVTKKRRGRVQDGRLASSFRAAQS